MSYTVYDFDETLERVGIKPGEVERVTAGWGRSPDGYGDWEGGFVLLLKDGTWVLVSGWCDTSGWGCQDGADCLRSTEEPQPAINDYSGHWRPFPPEQVDRDPADLNRFLRGESVDRMAEHP